MEFQRLWLLLNELAGRLAMEVRLEALEDGEGYLAHGGLCRMEGKMVVFVDLKSSVEDRCLQLGRALSSLELENEYLKPAVRDYLESLS